jgi:glycosyltransferase involved in cell wall biosynthesis
LKILFVYQELVTFVKKDLDILRSAYAVREVHFRGINDIPKLWGGVKWCDVSFSWFGSFHAFWSVLFSKLLKKKSIVVAGGYDVGQKDGLWAQRTKRWCPYYVFSNADLILTVSNYNHEEAIRNISADPQKTIRVYHGFDSAKMYPNPNIKKQHFVVSISEIAKHQIRRKGLELFVRAAALLPEVPFVLIGKWTDNSVDYLRSLSTPNMKFTGFIENNKMLDILSKAKVYVQISEHEAFGCGIAEAMLCECIPVVSNNTAIPEVVGDCGYYVDSFDHVEIAGKIKLAMKDFQTGKMARERIIKNFPLEKRKEELLKAVSLLGDQR